MNGRQVRVTIAGVEFTDDVIDEVRVTMGARTPWEQSVAGNAQVRLLTEQPDVAINDELVVDVESPDTVDATGGTETVVVDGGVRYRVHTFTSDGNLTVTGPGEVEYLIVGGGGGAGTTDTATANRPGAGGGGVLTGTIPVTAGSYQVTVGAGGARGPSDGAAGDDGGVSTFAGFTALGGAGAVGAPNVNGTSGSSGSGASAVGAGAPGRVGGSGVLGQGNDGGDTPFGVSGAAAGGGGAGTSGGNASTNTGGNGGDGFSSTITGATVYYGGGGGGGGLTTPGIGGLGGGGNAVAGGNGQDGTDGLGGGGGGVAAVSGLTYGGSGGSGVVIVRYRDTYQPVFTGQVGIVQNQIEEFGPVWTVQANGPLTRVGRRNVGTAIPADTDGDQIAELADAGLATQWQGAIGDWSEQTLTWAGFAVDKTNIDQPGLYDLAAITDTDANVIDEMTRAALSASGWLYETRDGLIGYADSTRRENTPVDNYLTIPGDLVSRQSFQTVTDEGDLANSITVAYDGGDITLNSTLSMGLYGRWERNYDTSLADLSAATQFATRRLEIEAAPRPTMAAPLFIDLLNAPATLVDQLLTIERNYGIIVEDVPTYVAPEGLYRGFVEGYAWVLDPILPVLEVFVSEYSLSNFGLRWAAAGPTRWNQVGASLTWQDATEDLS